LEFYNKQKANFFKRDLSMEAIKITRKIESETLNIPELKKFIGKNIEIIMLEIPSEKMVSAKKEKMKNFLNAAGNIDIDEKTVNELRQKSLL
jgi:nicotinate-nucleotide pyrophosphorylase